MSQDTNEEGNAENVDVLTRTVVSMKVEGVGKKVDCLPKPTSKMNILHTRSQYCLSERVSRVLNVREKFLSNLNQMRKIWTPNIRTRHTLY